MKSIQRAAALGVLVLSLLCETARCDEVIHAYEGDVLMSDLSSGWFFLAQPCIKECSEYIEGGAQVFMWDDGTQPVKHHRTISELPDPPPESLWVEWNFASNHAFVSGHLCDASFIIRYRHLGMTMHMFGDTAMSFGLIEFLGGLELDAFHTYRFESPDGVQGRVYVNGALLFERHGTVPEPEQNRIQINGEGGCSLASQPTFNRYDNVRYGTMSFGELIVSSDPPAGVIGSVEYPGFDRFTVTFDAPNYVLIDEVSVDVLPGMQRSLEGGRSQASGVPQVIKTRRPVNGPPDTVEIVLDRALPLNATTIFTFDDGEAVNVVEYTYVETGACCLGDGSCGVFDEADCLSQGGAFSANEPCGDPSACCFGGLCEPVPAACCGPFGGDPPQTPPGEGGENQGDLACDGDADGDGVDGVCGDQCPNDPNKTAPGQCGCGVSDLDSDGDGVPDCHDQCPGEDDTLDANDDGIPDCLQFPIIPTTTAWGLAVMSLLILIAAKLRERRTA